VYKYLWDEETGGLLLTDEQSKFSKEPRPVYYKELDILGFNQYWSYPKEDRAPLMWAEANNYIYKGRTVAKARGGSLYTAPELVLFEEPEPDGRMLEFVDIEGMVTKNQPLMETMAQEAIQEIYNTYRNYKHTKRHEVDVFYVAFSGGKDSIVVLDLVQRALPHSDFKVMFGNTGMEFPTTKKVASNISKYCLKEGIDFHEAKAAFSADTSWRRFGPPARRVRWCCTVHKTAPVINQLSELCKLNNLHSMMITGVRGDESASRADYDGLSFGKKLAGQYSFHPILNWSSSEVFLYIYSRKLEMNEAYKMGFNRVGCIMCPNSSAKHEYIKRYCFKNDVDNFCNLILDTSSKDLSGSNSQRFLETGGWKLRLSGRELKISEEERFSYEEKEKQLIFKAPKLGPEWKIWYTTLGKMDNDDPYYLLEFKGVWRKCFLRKEKDITVFEIENACRTKNSIEFIYLFKSVLVKTQYCIGCMACVAECSNRSIHMEDGKVVSIDNCVRCHACLKISNGCLYYNSIRGSRDMKSLKGVNRYLSVGVDAEWIKQFFADPAFEPGNRKTDVMFGFMRDAKIVEKRALTSFGELIAHIGLDRTASWAFMLCNLAYSPAFEWYIKNIPFNEPYLGEQLVLDMAETTKKAQLEFWNGFKTILDTNVAFREIGFGIPDITRKVLKSGEVRKSMHFITRTSWDNPIPEVILYSLYKFAEANGEYYQFSLATLLDDSIERDGISPTRIFGLNHDTMVRILNGLSVNYPEFISASFTLDLDNITLRSGKTSGEILKLFLGGEGTNE